MRSGMKMKLWEAENFLNKTSDVARSIADPWDIPGTSFDPQTLLGTILLKGGELGVLFNNVATFYKMNKYWWDKWAPTYQKWWIAHDKEYEPLWDRNGYVEIHEDTTDEGFSNTETSGSEVMDDDTTKTAHTVEVMDDDTTTSSTSSETVHTATQNTETTTNSVSAYDAGNNLVTHDSSTTNGSGSVDTTSSASSSGTGTDDRTTTTDYTEAGTDDRTTTTHGTSDNANGNDRDFDHARHEWGNWGISTTSQKLLQQEFETRYKYNPYELMANIYIREMTDGIWV